MNRPEARNAMSQEMNKAMQDTIAAFGTRITKSDALF